MSEALEKRIAELEKANSDLALAAIVPDGMKLIIWSDEYQEKGAVHYIMKTVHEYGIACVNMHIRSREGYGNIEDERKHQQALWCAIRDMINNEISMLQDACSEHAERLHSKLIINEVVSEHPEGDEANTMSWILKTPMKVGTKIFGVTPSL